MTHASAVPVQRAGKEAQEHVRIESSTAVVLDTSVLITDPEAVFSFGESTVVIPLTVVEELDNQKTRMDHVGRSARAAIRILEDLRVRNGGTLTTPVDLPNGGVLFIETNGLLLDVVEASGLDVGKSDNRILAAALGVQSRNIDVAVQVISGDVALRVKAAQMGVLAGEYVKVKGRPLENNLGWCTREVSKQLIDDLYRHEKVLFEEMDEAEKELFSEVRTNEFVILRAGQQSGMCRLTTHGLVQVAEETVWGMKARGKEQRFALNLLMDPAVPVVALSGVAGTGKTMLALAAGLEQVFEPGNKHYDRLMILRPLVAVGKQEVGFLPGSLEDKLGPWMEAIVDTMVALGTKVTYAQARDTLNQWVETNVLTMESVTYLRGRSLQRTFIIVDEAQNLEASVAKTILTRLGEGSKAVLLGDVEQTDSPWLGEHDNALAVTVGTLAGEELFGHLMLTKGERSAAAEMAARLL